MRLHPLLLAPALAAILACATAPGSRDASPAPAPTAADPDVLRSAELARVRCLLVAPFENGSDAALAGEAATGAMVSGVERAGTRVYPIPELRAMFRDTPLELPAGFGPSLANELATIVGADAVLTGAVLGRTRHGSPELLVSVRVAFSADHELLFAREALVLPAPGERVDAAVRRGVLDAARPMLEKIGGISRRRCFDPERAKVLRGLALATPNPTPSGLAPRTATPGATANATRTPTRTPTSTPTSTPTRRAAPQGPALTGRPAEWARRLAAGERLVVEELAFAGRTADLARDAGLVDLAAAAGALDGGAVHLEAFVDATSDRGGDERLSAAMAEAAARRLAALGVARGRLVPAGRGGESPLLPNFTARGRAANRRVEAVLVR